MNIDNLDPHDRILIKAYCLVVSLGIFTKEESLVAGGIINSLIAVHNGKADLIVAVENAHIAQIVWAYANQAKTTEPSEEQDNAVLAVIISRLKQSVSTA